MMSSNASFSEKELVLNLKKLFNESETDEEINNFEQELEEFKNDNLIILKEIQAILQNCSTLTDKEKWDYCNSQRYFMKLYLKEISKR